MDMIGSRVVVQTASDSYYMRRLAAMQGQSIAWINDPVINAIGCLQIMPESVLEIGCSYGWRIDKLREFYGCKGYGIDSSPMAIKEGQAIYPELSLSVGFADNLPYSSGRFDCVIFGFCLYLCNRENLFRIAAEGDRVLKSGGYMVIYDFYPNVPHQNRNVDDPRATTYKMDYSAMYSWHPHYKIVHRNVLVEPGNVAEDKICVIVFNKQ